MSDVDDDSHSLPLGLTCSFPVESTALDRSRLLTWAKGFTAKNTLSKCAWLLQDALHQEACRVSARVLEHLG